MQKKAISTADQGALPPVLYRGSVKDVRGYADGDSVLFEYSDRYSVFDWGEMPDHLDRKGEALALLTDEIYRRLEQEGITTHAIGLADVAGQTLTAAAPTRYWKVQACQRKLPEWRDSRWNYDWYSSPEAHGYSRNVLIPLEVVFRFGVTEGSSFFSRSTPDYLRALGLSRAPVAGQMLERPVVEYFTKLEETDRFLTVDEARKIAGLTATEELELKEQTLRIAALLRRWFASCGLELWDGKFEFAYQPGRKLCLVDAIGPDEMRLTGGSGVHVSKEILRDHYRGSSWYQALADSKQMARDRHVVDWKAICRDELKAQPELLPDTIKTFATNLYLALANDFLGRQVFAGVPSLQELLEHKP